VKYEIVGGSQRFRSDANFDPMATAMGALALAGESAIAPGPEKLVKGRNLRVVGS
jgi:hypothetical protein